MNLAITLLVVIGIAAIIGTVLQQNEPYANYVLKFGPFWFEVFKALGLFDIYGSFWFIFLLGFLLISTAVCVWRNTPHILQDMRQFRLDVQEKSLRSFHLRGEWDTIQPVDQAAGRATALLSARGYRVRRRDHDGHLVLGAMKGSSGRLGYILSHLSIVVICIGGLIDGNLPFRLKELTGQLAIETHDLPVSQIPAKSTLGTDNLSFRGSVTIPEGSQADFVYLPLRDGYLLQKLPFSIALDDFRIEHYASGMPKSFESDVVIMDPASKQPLHKTIAVNHPLVYKGYAIYQSSFSDGGSALKLKAWSLDLPTKEPLALESAVNQSLKIMTTRGERSLEFSDFKAYNIFPADPNDKSGKQFHNYGPSFTYKARNAEGEALEYVNYMAPVTIDGRDYFMSGMRSTPSEDFRYLYIPADTNNGVERFMHFLAAARDEDHVQRAVVHQLAEAIPGDDAAADHQRSTMATSITQLVNLFLSKGIDGVLAQTEKNIPEAKRKEAMSSYVSILQGVLGAVYVDVLTQEGVDMSKGVSERDSHFFDDAMNAFALLGPYDSPFYLQLADFTQVQASGLQITRAPGKDVVYLGCIMLMAGVFMMFYLHHRRVWVRLAAGAKGTSLVFAGSGHRGAKEFEREFNALRAELEQALPGATDEA